LGKHQGAPLTPISNRRDRRRLTNHHCVPRSRNGPDTLINIRLKGVREHYAWHQLFRNSTPEEIIELIRKFGKDGLAGKNPKKNHYWRIIFGKKNTIEQWVEVVENYWTPPRVK